MIYAKTILVMNNLPILISTLPNSTTIWAFLQTADPANHPLYQSIYSNKPTIAFPSHWLHRHSWSWSVRQISPPWCGVVEELVLGDEGGDGFGFTEGDGLGERLGLLLSAVGWARAIPF